jgi:signal transduction histidine kinase
MTESSKPNLESNALPREGTRTEGQATLSAIGDVSMAATAAVNGVGAASGKTRWLPILGFLLLAYIAGSMAAIYTHKSPPWAQVFVAPLVVVLLATLAYWRRQVWKFRARHANFKEKEQVNRLNSLAHETANGLNAIRANLAGALPSSSEQTSAEHRKQVEQALERIETALAKAIGATPSPQAKGLKVDSEAVKSKAA